MLSPLPFLLLGLPFVASTPIESRASSSTQNGITDGSGCKPMMVVFARGTTEGGNVGSVVGPPFSDALSSAMGAGNVAFQGVDYPASIPGFLAGGDANGSKSMAQTVTQTIQKCPNSSVVMSGYRYKSKPAGTVLFMLTPSKPGRSTRSQCCKANGSSHSCKS